MKKTFTMLLFMFWRSIFFLEKFLLINRNKKPQRRAYAFVAGNMQGVEVFLGVNFSLANTAIGALLEAMMEAGIIAKNYGI